MGEVKRRIGIKDNFYKVEDYIDFLFYLDYDFIRASYVLEVIVHSKLDHFSKQIIFHKTHKR